MSLRTEFLHKMIPYTGAELRPHFIAEQTKHFGNSVIAFLGPCDVATGEMVDLEDQFQGSHIRAKQMLHFIAEWFEGDLALAIARQRLWIADFKDLLQAKLPAADAAKIWRRGNDLYYGTGAETKKLSVSIVTATPVSTLFHFGVNVDANGSPVPAMGLQNFSVDPQKLAGEALEKWQSEWNFMIKARAKVSPR
jgi:hypothetical protein